MSARHRVLVVNGHPDPRPERLCSALCAAYTAGALAAGREVRRLDVGSMDFPLVRTAQDFTDGPPPAIIAEAQAQIRWADHLVIVHPLWLGGPPALLKAFLEQVFRYGFALSAEGRMSLKGLLGGRSARLVVTMGMPALIYRLVFGAFGERALTRGVLWIAGVRPVGMTLMGGVAQDRPANQRFIETARRLGERGR